MVKCMWRQPHPPVEFAVIRLEGGPTESHSRLSIDALFRQPPCLAAAGLSEQSLRESYAMSELEG